MVELMTIATPLSSTAWYRIRLHYASRCADLPRSRSREGSGKQHDILTCLVASQVLEPRA
jgi:hypothetical protein